MKIYEPTPARHAFMGYEPHGFAGIPMLSRNRIVFEAEGAGDGGAGSEETTPTNTPEPASNTPPAQKPSDESAKLLKEVMKHKDEAKALKDQLKRFEGIDPEAVRTILAERETAERERAQAAERAEEERLKAAGDYEALRRKMADEHTKAIKERDEREAELAKKITGLQSTIGDLTVGRGFSDSQFVRDSLVLTPSKARVVYGSHFDVVDGKVVGYDKPKGAPDRAPLVRADGSHLSFEDALKAIVESDPEKEQILRSTTKAGTAIKNSPEGKNTHAPKLFGTSRIAAALAAGR